MTGIPDTIVPDMPIRTPVAARMVGIALSHLHSLIRHGRIAAPRKDSSGVYVWGPDDILAARQALAVHDDRSSEVACP